MLGGGDARGVLGRGLERVAELGWARSGPGLRGRRSACLGAVRGELDEAVGKGTSGAAFDFFALVEVFEDFGCGG